MLCGPCACRCPCSSLTANCLPLMLYTVSCAVTPSAEGHNRPLYQPPLTVAMFSCFQRIIGLVAGGADAPTDRYAS